MNSIANSNPLAPVFLPEFGQPVSWAMCRNPSCANFGIHYEGPPPGDQGSVTDARYRIECKTGRFRCKSCEQSFTLKSNRAIRPLARYFLGLSLPFADCPNPACANRGYNAFEHYTDRPRVRARRYRPDGEHKMICRYCRQKFHLGEALHLTRSRDRKKSLREIVDGVRTRRSVTDAIELTGIATGTYYERLFRIGARLRDYHAWRNARLLHEEFGGSDEPVRVFTDTLQVSLQRWGDASRFQILDLVTSVVAVGRTYYILAAHPGFLPDKQCPDDSELWQEMYAPGFLAAWDCVNHTFRIDTSGSVEDRTSSISDVGRRGYFGTPYYVELAHFLVVRKMLSRFREVHYVMDGARPLYTAALTALAKDIREERAEVVLFQHETDQRKKAKIPLAKSVARDKREDWLKSQLDAAWGDMRARFAERAEEGQQELFDEKSDPKRSARLFKHAFRGGYSGSGEWAWLVYPPNTPMYLDARILWLTWNPGKSYENQGRELLWRTTLQPVDSAFNFLRQRTYGLQRAVFRAMPGRSYLDAYIDPRAICSELWIVLLWRNFGLRTKFTARRRPQEKTAQTPSADGADGAPPAKPPERELPERKPPADAMGLTTPKEKAPDLVRHVWDFRLGVTHAARMSRWLRA